MRLGYRVASMIGLAVALASPVVAQELDTEALLERIDERQTFSDTDFASTVTIISEDPEEGTERMVVRQFRRDQEDKFLLLIQEPAVQRGQGYLRVDDNLWIYDPESRQFTLSSARESFQGTDARNSDFEASSLAEDYNVASYESGTLGRYDVWIIELEATHAEVTYPRVRAWVTSDEDNLVLKTEDYSATDRLVRTSYFPQYREIDGNFVVTRALFVDELVEGRRTQIQVDDVSLESLPDSVFTKAYVERVNR
ncbi:MAG: outer membrane lipoprotein-sorting protein [Spirochaetota bacterium]